jgi:hypothetical protein
VALTFSANTHRVNFGSGTTLDNNIRTVLVWFYPTSIAVTAILLGKTHTSYSSYLECSYNSTGDFILDVLYSGGGARSRSAGGFIVANAWNFVGFSMDGVASAKLYKGTLTSAAAEPGSYTTQATPSGSYVSDAANDLILGTGPSNTNGVVGRIAWIGIWNRALTAGEIIEQQWRPHVTSGCVLFTHLGYRGGTSSQPDWSGNSNAGTVTGAAVGAHVPVRISSGGVRNPQYVVVATTNTYTYSGSGGATSAGVAGIATGKAYAATGGATAAGAALVSRARVYVPTGGATASGVAVVSKSKAYAPTGGATVSGAAVLARTYSPTVSGGGVSGGTASRVRTYSPVVGGGATTGGTVGVTRTYSPVVSGGAVAGGAATSSLVVAGTTVFTYSGTGGAASAGTAAVSRAITLVGSGGATSGGVATVTRGLAYTASGGAVASGAAQVRRTYARTGVGNAVSGGAGAYQYIPFVAAISSTVGIVTLSHRNHGVTVQVYESQVSISTANATVSILSKP